MKALLGLAGIFLASLLLDPQAPERSESRTSSRPSSRATSRPSQDASKVKLSDADMKKLAEKLAAVRDADSAKSEGARKEFAKEFDRVDKTVKPAFLISLWETWNEIFYSIRTLPKAPSGLGRVEEKSVSATHAGKPVEFKYGLILPNGFDVKKKYPLIVALHDKGASKDDKVTGVKYLQDVWMDTKTLPKEERDKFIIIAPTMGPGSAGKEYRVEWGDILHIKSVYLPMLEMLAKYPVDNERIYLDGTGEGGEFALQLGLLKPHAWAAVAARSALPRTLQLLQNGGSLPISIHLRTGTPVQSGQPRQNFDHQVQTLGLPAELKEWPASEKPYRGGFASDPIGEATAPIVAFFGQKTRVLYPKKLTFTTDTSIFKEAYWVRLIKHESGDQHFAKITGSVDAGENLIDLTTEGIEEFKIYLSDRLLDLGRPVKINVNGRPHTERQFTRDLDVFLNYYVANPYDPALQPCAFLELKVAAATESRPDSTESKSAPPKPPK